MKKMKDTYVDSYIKLKRHSPVRPPAKLAKVRIHMSLDHIRKSLLLMKYTGKLKTLFNALFAPKLLLENAVSFYRDWSSQSQCQYLGERLTAERVALESINHDIHLFKFRMNHDFILRIDQCLIVFPPGDLPVTGIISQVKKVVEFGIHICVFITTNKHQQSELRGISLDTTNMMVTPDTRELITLLLTSSPLDVFARLIASQVKLSRISPFQTVGGINKGSMFFGREELLARILRRKPANYLLTGGRQVGKSSLLKAIERQYREDYTVRCHYLTLTGPEIVPPLAWSLNLPEDTPLPEILETMRQVTRGKTRLFLIDEADMFIAAEAKAGYTILEHFCRLSKGKRCHFILAGSWNLFHEAPFGSPSHLKKFGEILIVEELEAGACRELATKPMERLNIHYESDELVDKLLYETGNRPNLIASICNEILKQVKMTDRLIRRKYLEDALNGDAVAESLRGWTSITPDQNSNRLDRIIVYTTIRCESFSRMELLQMLESTGVKYEPEQVNQSLARLELAFILKQEKNRFTYRVPLFKKEVLQQNPEMLLLHELNSRQSRKKEIRAGN